jgi:hypothetical protein
MIEPEQWTVAFYRTSPYWWVRLLAVGRYKHVSAFAYVAACKVWVYYDITLFGTKIIVLPDSPDAIEWLCAQTRGADLVKVEVHPRARRVPLLAPFCCVPAIRHLLGIPGGALLPSTLFDHCLANGAGIVDGTSPNPAAGHAGDARAGATGGA